MDGAVDVPLVPRERITFDGTHLVAVVPHWFGDGCGEARAVQTGAVLSSDPWDHAEMIDVGMRDDGIRHLWGFARVAWGIRWRKPVVKQKPGPRRVLHDDAHVSDFIATPKAVEPHTGRRWKVRIGRGSSWTVHDHA